MRLENQQSIQKSKLKASNAALEDALGLVAHYFEASSLFSDSVESDLFSVS